MNARHLSGQRARLPILPTPGLTDSRFTRLRFMSADAGAAGTPGAPADGGAGGDGGQTPPAVPAAPAEQPPAPKPAPPAPRPGESAQTFSREYVSELRTEAKTNREARQQAEQALQTLQAERDAAQAELATLRSEGALTAAITAAGGNSVAALAIKGADVLKGVDLASTDAVNAAVKTFIDEHPELKAGPSAVRSSVPGAGGTGEQGARPTSIREALERASR
jgi:hypothetical protein